MNRLLLLLIIPVSVFAWDFTQERNTIPVEFNGVPAQSPWNTGWNYIQPIFCDLDNDDDMDLIFGSDWNKIVFFRNIGDTIIFSFIFETDSMVTINSQPVSQITAKPAFVDIDNDNDLDLFIGMWYYYPVSRGRLLFYRNIGNNQYYNYELVTENYQELEFNGDIYPTFIDLDDDGDYDLVIGMGDIGSLDGRVFYYRNAGAPDSAYYVLVTQDLVNTGLDHTAIPSFCDIDNDGDYDLFVGKDDGGIQFYLNNGDSINCNFIFEYENYQNINVGRFASPFFCDIDGDGDYDLFVGERSWGEDNRHGDIDYYRFGKCLCLQHN